MDSLHVSISIQDAVDLIDQSISDLRNAMTETRFTSLESYREKYGELQGMKTLRWGFLELAKSLNKDED